MNVALLIVRFILAFVFVLTGVMKLIDKDSSRQAMTDFGIPAILAPSFGLLLPIVELGIAAMLIPTATAWWGAIGAIGLLLFIVGITYNLVRGRQLDCHCFGQIHSEPVGWSTLVRNGIFAAAADFIVWQGPQEVGLSLVEWWNTSLLTGMEIFVTVVILVLGLTLVGAWVVIYQLMKQHDRIILRLDDLEEMLCRVR